MKQNPKKLMTSGDFIKLDDHPVERDIMKRTLDHLLKLEQDHLEVSTLLVTKEFKDPDTENVYPVGYVCKNDGHGRAYIWKNKLSDIQPNEVSVTIYEVDSWEKMESIYDHTDSGKAVEKPKEKFIARLKKHGVHIHDNKLGMVQPLGFAANLLNSKKNPSTGPLSTAQINEAVKLLHLEYQVMEEYVCAGDTALHKKSKSRPFEFNNVLTTAALIALKSFKVTPELLDLKDTDTDDLMYVNAEKLINLIKQINKGGKNTMVDRWNPVTQIVNEFDGNGTYLSHWHKSGNDPRPALNLGSYVQCVSFVLYWMLQDMMDKTHENLPKNKKDWATMAKDFPEVVKKNFVPLYSPDNIENLFKAA